MDDENDTRGGDAPCFAHQVIGGESIDPQQARDVARFRKAERVRLLGVRRMPSEARQAATESLVEALNTHVEPQPGQRIAVYWPIRGEPDLRGWMASSHARGARVLLPVVVARDHPLEFHLWSPGCAMKRGIWNIPVPDGAAADTPDLVISPLVGIDDALYRLGNGGGYYDRTLAALEPRPKVIGVGFSGCRIETIFPMPWDVPMDEALLSDGTHLLR